MGPTAFQRAEMVLSAIWPIWTCKRAHRHTPAWRKPVTFFKTRYVFCRVLHPMCYDQRRKHGGQNVGYRLPSPRNLTSVCLQGDTQKSKEGPHKQLACRGWR